MNKQSTFKVITRKKLDSVCKTARKRKMKKTKPKCRIKSIQIIHHTVYIIKQMTIIGQHNSRKSKK